MKRFRVYWSFDWHDHIQRGVDDDLSGLSHLEVMASDKQDALSKAWNQLGKNPIMVMVRAEQID